MLVVANRVLGSGRLGCYTGCVEGGRQRDGCSTIRGPGIGGLGGGVNGWCCRSTVAVDVCDHGALGLLTSWANAHTVWCFCLGHIHELR